MTHPTIIIGRSEYIDLVGLATSVPAKIDTGAYRSAVHATNVTVENVNGEKVLKCSLLGHPCSPVPHPFQTTEFQEAKVINSFGDEETRYVINLKVKMGSKAFRTSFTLADRTRTLFPVLAGRKLLKNRFMVDVSKANVDRKSLKNKFSIDLPMYEDDLE